MLTNLIINRLAFTIKKTDTFFIFHCLAHSELCTIFALRMFLVRNSQFLNDFLPTVNWYGMIV